MKIFCIVILYLCLGYLCDSIFSRGSPSAFGVFLWPVLLTGATILFILYKLKLIDLDLKNRKD